MTTQEDLTDDQIKMILMAAETANVSDPGETAIEMYRELVDPPKIIDLCKEVLELRETVGAIREQVDEAMQIVDGQTELTGIDRAATMRAIVYQIAAWARPEDKQS